MPIAVPALLRTSWWPMISFVVFKAPPEGRIHIFRPGEPFMQILFLPAEPQFELVPMDEDEAAGREMRYRRIHASRETLGKTRPGRPRPTPCSTPPIVISCARPGPRPERLAPE